MNTSFSVIGANIISNATYNISRSGGKSASSRDITDFCFATEGLILSTIALLGIIGNLLSLIILSHPRMKTSMNCLLQALAVYDTLLLMTSLLIFGLYAVGLRGGILKHYTEKIYPLLKPVLLPFAYIAHTGSIWSTVSVTVERYVAVCHVLRAKTLFTCSRSRILNIIVAVAVVGYNMPSFWEWERTESKNMRRNITIHITRETEFSKSHFYSVVYLMWMDGIILHFMPYTILAVLNMFIWCRVRNSRIERKSSCPGQQPGNNNKLATMLICVVAVFFVCNIFAFVHKILGYLGVSEPSIVSITNLLITLNSAVNFIIYYIFSKKFKGIFLSMFCTCRLCPTHFTRYSFKTTSSVRFQKKHSTISTRRSSEGGAP